MYISKLRVCVLEFSEVHERSKLAFPKLEAGKPSKEHWIS